MSISLVSPVSYKNGNVLENDCSQTIPIFYNSTVEITGFQFQILGDINILECIGGNSQSSGGLTTGQFIRVVLGLLTLIAGAFLITLVIRVRNQDDEPKFE